MADHPISTISIRDCRIRLMRGGSGSPLLFLHGGGRGGGWIAAELAVRNSGRLASLTLIGAAGIHVKGVEQVDTFLSNEQQRIRDLFYDQELAEAVIASSERPEQEDTALKNRIITAKLS